MKRMFACFLLIGAISMAFSVEAKAAQFLPESDGQCYFSETFSDKVIFNNWVQDKTGKIVWHINNEYEQINMITDTGALELGNSRYIQRAVLDDKLMGNRLNYAMEFSINVQKLGNEGDSARPIAVIIPRSKDAEFNEYYAVTYYMENTVANQFKFKWAIVNTAAPTKMEPLVEGYYLLRENVDYTARLIIQNTDDENVNIKFYIDGPINPAKEYKPLLEYTDTSKYKILSGFSGPALGMIGYSTDRWGTSPTVRYDNIKLYDVNEYAKYEEQLKKYALMNLSDLDSIKANEDIKYLVNRGLLSGYSDNNFKPYGNVSVAQFLKMLIGLKGEKCPAGESYWADNYIKRGIELGIIKANEFSDYNKPITRYDAALMITRLKGNPTPIGDIRYAAFVKDYKEIPDKYSNAVLYAYYEGNLTLNENNEFKGNNPISRENAATIMMRMLDVGYKKMSYNLELPAILSSGAVLQGNKRIPVWGRGVSGETITVNFRGQVKTTVVKNGHWYLELDPVSYGGPFYLYVKNAKKTIILEDIWVGEVYIVAGQSNSEMFLIDCNDSEKTREKFTNNSKLRFYNGEQITSVTPNFTNVASWKPTEPWEVNCSPAVGTFFIERLLEVNEDLKDVMIGLISMTYGGSTIEAFMPNVINEESNYVQKDNEPIRSGFWNGFMEPIAPFGVQGVIYYQGENSAQLRYQYEPMLRNYLRGLRTEFNDPNLPVMLVQLAGYGYNNYQSDIDDWPVIRGVQQKVANTTINVGLVTAVDLADANPVEIHPKEKKQIARRLASLAMGMIYGKGIDKRSAELKSYQFDGNKIIVGFNDDYGKIYFKDNASLDFQVLDKQGKWNMANATIDSTNNMVKIWSDEVLEPVGARYAWVNYPSISLYNNVGLPVLPFRFIDLPQTTERIIKITNHSLKSNDAIVNTTRGNVFRVIVDVDENTVVHEYAIKGQMTGDSIEKLARIGNLRTLEDTTETIIKIRQHGLSVGDWIRNDTRGWEPRRVEKVLDEDTIEVKAIKGQSAGDEIEGYQLMGKDSAK